MSMALFFYITTILLLFIAAGLFATSIHELQEATESYEQVVWKLDCCDPNKNHFWSIMSKVFGWRSEATVGTTVGYFVYWIVVGLVALFLWYKVRKNQKVLKNSSSENNDQTYNTEIIEGNEKNDQAAVANVA
jgi:high-affinity iron transporter